MPSYYDDWKTAEFHCKRCGWNGPGADLVQGEIFSDLAEVDCPNCGEVVTTVVFPTLDEMRQNWDKVPAADKAMVERIEKKLAAYKRSALREPGQLPDLEGDDLILVWDIEYFEGGDILIRYGSRVLWRETSFYEGYRRFIEVADILQRKYGERLQDLVPTRKSYLYLYGDSISAAGIVDACRKKLDTRFKLP